MEFANGVILRIAPITVITYLISYIPIEVDTPLFKIVIIAAMTLVVNMVLILSIGLNKDERLVVKRNLKSLYEKYRRS
jgi:hypothetical protein